jgi:ParB family chromosome partitioning protein
MTRTALARTAKQSLSKYDPQKGLKKIALLEGVEKHFARAKDATKLEQAIRAKLEAQAEFVFWWDTQAKKDKGGGDVRNTRRRSVTGVQTAGRDGLPDRSVIDRWRRKLNDPDRFETAYAQAVARYGKILEFEQAVHVGQNSGELEWYTPEKYIEAARAVLGSIDLDPASTDVANRIVKAEQIFTAEDDGLRQQWDGRVWMNPPYAQPLITQFCEKLAASVRAGTVPAAVVLVNNATETQWFRAVADVAAALCFPAGRISYWYPDRSSVTGLQGQTFLYIGPDVAAFCAQFAPFGFLAEIRR